MEKLPTGVKDFVALVEKQIGKPYVWATAGPNSFDCSGLVYYCYNQTASRQLDESHRDSHILFQIGVPGIPADAIKAGDLLFYDTANGQEVRHGNAASHVAIAVSDTHMVHALNPQKGVIKSKINSEWFQSRLIGIHRIFAVENTKPVEEPVVVGPEPDKVPVEDGDILVPEKASLPTGTIQAKRPNGSAWGFGWDRVSRWEPAFANAAQEFGLDPYLMPCMTLIESDANQFRTGKTTGTRSEVITRDDGFGDGLSVGLTQIKPQLWGSMVPNADPYTAEGNIRLGSAFMADAIRRRGSWQQALIRDYFPSDDPNGTTQNMYVNCLTALLNEAKGTVVEDPLRPMPWPTMRKAHVVKPGEGAGFDRVSHRGPRIVGSCNHITDGVPGGDQITWYKNFFSTGGERQWDALVDVVIATNGEIGLLNDWRDPDWGGRRAGWANGGADGLEGDGVAFYKAYPDINSVLVSKEHVTTVGRKLTDAQIQSSIKLSAAVAQNSKCPWDTYPRNPNAKNVVVEQQHRNFATKSCPAEPFISTHFPVIVRGVKEELKKWQGGATTPTPEEQYYTKFGMRVEQLSYLFGSMTRVEDNGTVLELEFSPTGPLSLLWLERCEREGIFPEAEEMRSWDSQLAEGKEWFATWEGGWVAWLPIDNQRAGWRWLEGS